MYKLLIHHLEIHFFDKFQKNVVYHYLNMDVKKMVLDLQKLTHLSNSTQILGSSRSNLTLISAQETAGSDFSRQD